MRLQTLPVMLAWALARWAAPDAIAETVILKPVADTTLFAAVTANNLGGEISLAVGGNGKKQPGRGLLRFDVAQDVPMGATISRVVLAFTVTKGPPAGEASTFSAHRFLTAWFEGTGQLNNLGRPAIAGESTWLHRVHPDDPWPTPGGASGINFVAAASAGTPVETDGRYEFQGPGLIADVQLWLADPTQNQGWLLMSDAETTAFTARRVGSRDDPNHAPSLTIDYSLANRPVIHRFGRVGDQFELEFLAEAGNIYEVQFAGQIEAASPWTALTNYVAKLVTTNIVFSDSLLTAPRRFYRVADVGDVD